MSLHEPDNQRRIIIDAMRDAWKQDSSKVAEFGLSWVEDGIRPVATGWSVPVVSGVPTGSAYELVRVLDQLQERIEGQSGLSVTLFLDPFSGQQVPSAPSKKAS